MRPLLYAAILCAFAQAAEARPFTVDDLLKLEAAGQAQFAPGGRWLVIQTFAGQETAGRFDSDHQYRRALGRLWVVDLARPGQARPLLAAKSGVGYTPGPISPSGRRMLVNRLADGVWEAGIVELATGQGRWLGVSIDLPIWGRSAAWRSDEELIALVTPRDRPPLYLRVGSQAQAVLPERWARTARGEESVTVIGSGAHLGRGAAAPASRLVSIRAADGAVTELAKAEYFDLELSRDGRYVAAERLAGDIQLAPDQPPHGASATRERALDVVDLERRSIWRPAADYDLASHLLVWSPTGGRLLVYGRKPGQSWEAGRLLIADPANRETRTLAQKPAVVSVDGVETVRAGWWFNAPFTWTGPESGWRWADRPAATVAPLPNGSSRVYTTGRRAIALSGGRLWTAAAPDAAPVDRGTWRTLPTGAFGDGSRISSAAIEQGESLVGVRGERLQRATADGRIEDLAALSADESVLAVGDDRILVARADARGRTALILRRGQADQTVLTLNGFLETVDFGGMAPIAHVGRDGAVLTSWLILPAKPVSHPPPVVVLPYPGAVYEATKAPEAVAPGAPSFTTNAQLIAAHGYAALVPSLPRDAASHEPAAGLARDILSAVDAAGAQGLIDSRRVALWGQSFGGFAALSAAAQSDRFFAVVDTAGPTDLSFSQGRVLPQGRVRPEDGLTLLAAIGWAETGQAGLGAPPWVAPERYWRNSPRLQADKIKAPILLAYGDLDPVGLDEGEAMFSALYRQGKDARLLTFWGEGHVILSPGNVRRLYGEALAWLDEALARRDAAASTERRAP